MTKQETEEQKTDSRNFFHFAALVANRPESGKQNVHLASLKRSKRLEPKLQKCLASFEKPAIDLIGSEHENK